MEQYPFCRLSGTANVLVMPAIHSAAISTKMLQELGGLTVMGPLLIGLDKSVQIAQMGAKDSDIVNMAAIRPITRSLIKPRMPFKRKQAAFASRSISSSISRFSQRLNFSTLSERRAFSAVTSSGRSRLHRGPKGATSWPCCN